VRTFVDTLAFDTLLGIIGISTWKVGFIPQNAWAWLKKNDNLIEAIRASKVTYAKPLKVVLGI
jgi:hypothetical protein